ncbi:MAG: carboxypeptidase-like regulatory domain-containing protein [Gemmataceae bacterium]|nr:carboxypeptidase-like regulatory domain-containing protein [Gemmataceae bacterium]
MWRACLPLMLLLGCSDAPPLPPHEAPTPSIPSTTNFDAATAGTIQGSVTWEGLVPSVARYTIPPSVAGAGPRQAMRFDNPHVPRIAVGSRGVANAVVFLRGVDPARSRPWDHPPVEIEQRDYRLNVLQGSHFGRSGFVRRGDSISMVSRQPIHHVVHAEGAAFFSLTLADPDRPRQRPLTKKGVVELGSAAGYFWMRAHVFVDDHPYYCRTDDEGRFTLPDVPPGRYEVICWMPNWVEDDRNRDPESGNVIRVFYKRPVEVTRSVNLAPQATEQVRFTLSAEAFKR